MFILFVLDEMWHASKYYCSKLLVIRSFKVCGMQNLDWDHKSTCCAKMFFCIVKMALEANYQEVKIYVLRIRKFWVNILKEAINLKVSHFGN